MSTTKILIGVAFVAAVLGPAALTGTVAKVVSETGAKPAVALTVHGKTGCVLLAEAVHCGPAIGPNPMLLASADLN